MPTRGESAAVARRAYLSGNLGRLLHHHPVLIPSLAEAYQEYDAVEQSGHVLNILHEFGFHIMLHGHKHHPLIFSEDIRNAFEMVKDNPMMIVAGGSAGSSALPESGTNTYNKINIKWHPDANQTRIRILTRGLIIRNIKTKRSLISSNWTWRTLREDDRSFSEPEFMSASKAISAVIQLFQDADRLDQEKEREAEYARSRGNFAVAEIRPSLLPGQAYEATCWIVPHRPDRRSYEAPIEVVWSAGPKVPVKRVRREQDPNVRVTFTYWGSMLVHAELLFGEGPACFVYVYAQSPGIRSQ